MAFTLILAAELLDRAAEAAEDDSFDSFLIQKVADQLTDGKESTQAKVSLAPSQYKAFAEAVTRAYDARPSMQPEVVPSWNAAAAFIEKQFKQSLSRIKVEFVESDPYNSYDEMAEQVKKTGVLKIWTGASQHPVWTPKQNWLFRAVHDYQSHIAGDHQFGLRGEIQAYNRHIKTFPRAAWLCMFTEIIGQVSYYETKKEFAEQKVCALYGFDYGNIGAVDAEAYKKNFTEADQ